MRNVIVHHANCVDGAMSAAVAFRALRDLGEGEAVLVAASYQHPLSDLLKEGGGACYVVDFSFSPAETDRLASMFGRVVVIDHHKTAMERFAEAWSVPFSRRMRCVPASAPDVLLDFDMDRSGAMLAWEHFRPGEEPPGIVRHVEDYDLWRHELPDSKAVHACLRSHDCDVAKFVEILDADRRFNFTAEGARRYPSHVEQSPLDEAIEEGRAILRANGQQAKSLAERPERVSFAGIVALASNAPVYQDDVCARLYERDDNPSGVGIAWSWREGRYKVSVRSTPKDGSQFDCSAAAKVYGGGGHVGAAGFACDALPWRRP